MLKTLILTLLFFYPLAFLSGQRTHDRDSAYSVRDTVRLREVSVTNARETKVSGMLTGNLKWHTDQLQSIPSLTGTVDVLKLMELTPSVRNSGDGSSNMYVRGGDAGQNRMLYNGVATYSPGHFLGIFPLFNADHLSWVKMNKAAADAEHGNYISAVIEVNSKEQIPERFSVKGNTGLLATQFTAQIPVSTNWGVYFSGRKTYLELLVKPVIDSQFSTDTDEDTDINYDFWDTNLTVVGKLNNRHTLGVDLLVGGDKLKMDDRQIMIDGALKWNSVLSSIRLQSLLPEDIRMSQVVAFSHYQNKLDTKQGEMLINLQSSIDDLSYKNKLDFSIDDLPVTAGLSYVYHRIQPHDLYAVNSGYVTNSVQEERIEAHAVSAFASTSWNPLERFNIKPSLRYNSFFSKPGAQGEYKGFHSLDFRFSSQYQSGELEFLRANYSHNNQYVNKLSPSSVGLPTDFWVAATKYLKPQQGDEISLGYYRIMSGGKFELSADIYYRWMRNVTQFDYNFIENENVSFTDKISYGTGRAYGLEAMLKKNYGKLTGWISYALSRSDRKFAEINEGKRFPARYDRTHDLSATFHYTLNDRWDLSLTYLYATGNAYTQPTSWYFINNLPVKEYTDYNNARMPDYKRVDVGLNYWFKKDNGLNFSVYNLLMESNPLYIFLVIKEDPKKEITKLSINRKVLYRFIPSISWNFKF